MVIDITGISFWFLVKKIDVQATQSLGRKSVTINKYNQ
jgi:hypothetical protein